MTYDINALRNISKSTVETVNSKNGDDKKYAPDPRFWTLGKDEKTKNGSAVIRFLPSLKADELPWVQTFSYFIECENGWYVADSLKTIGQKDPMAEYISKMWEKAKANNDETLTQMLRSKYRVRMQYISNILVVHDPKNPENDGKVFLFKFGKKIYDKIISKMHAVDEFDEPCNVFDWTEGANFKLRMKYIDKYPNYDSSEFGPASSLSDEQIEEIANQMYDLKEFVDPAKFKSYDELKARVDLVCGLTKQEATSVTEAKSVEYDDDDDIEYVPKTTTAPKTTTKKSETPWDDDDISFESLTEEVNKELDAPF